MFQVNKFGKNNMSYPGFNLCCYRLLQDDGSVFQPNPLLVFQNGSFYDGLSLGTLVTQPLQGQLSFSVLNTTTS